MNYRSLTLALLALFPLSLMAEEPTSPAKAIAPAKTASETAPKPADDAALRKEQEHLALHNSLLDERVKHETSEMRIEVARLKAEKELMAERLAHATLKRQVEDEVEAAKTEAEKARLTREAEIAKARAEALTYELKAVEAESSLEITRLRGEITTIETRAKRLGYADATPEYLKKPLREDGTLVISDRRIALNGPILPETAVRVSDRINYYNNQDRELPIFIVIDDSPGGSVMAGYRILKSMESSDAPIHVVVKSFAASMAAGITTLAEESYAYPNAVILHHQISATVIGRLNLTQQQEFLRESQRWWDRLATPIATKMGISTDAFIRQMYEHSSSGDWSEFGEEARRLKWVNHIVSGIEETSLLRNPDLQSADSAKTTPSALSESLDEEGKPTVYLPRLNPKDVYFLYNPDAYYRLR